VDIGSVSLCSLGGMRRHCVIKSRRALPLGPRFSGPWFIIRSKIMKTIKEVVESYLQMTQLRQYLYHGYDLSDICDQLRGPVWQTCLELGITSSIHDQVVAVIKQAIALDDTLVGDDVVKERTRLTISPENEAELIAMTPRRVSRWGNHSTSEVAEEAAHSLEQVEWIVDPEINETLNAVYDEIGKTDIEARDKRYPVRTVEELNAIGDSTFRVRFSTFDKADRIYADTKGVVASMWEKDSRARNVMPYSRKTSLTRQEKYMEGLGLNQSLTAEILADPTKYILNGGNPLLYAQCVSWHRIATTGKTNILVEGDAKSSGYVHQLLMMRDTEALMRGLPFRKSFKHLHLTVAEGLRRDIPALKVYSTEDLVALAKGGVTPSLYGAGVKGLFSNCAKAQAVEDLLKDGKYKPIELHPILSEMFGEPTPEDIDEDVDWNYVRADMYWAYCVKFASVFRSKVPKVPVFVEYWRDHWKEHSSPEGLWIERCDGTQVLCPRLKRNKFSRTSYHHEIFEAGQVRPSTETANLFSPHMDDKGTSAAAFVIHNRDSFSMATAIVKARGGIKAAIHDATLFFLADVHNVQRSYTFGVNKAHRLDLMKTDRDQVIIPENEWMLGF